MKILSKLFRWLVKAGIKACKVGLHSLFYEAVLAMRDMIAGKILGEEITSLHHATDDEDEDPYESYQPASSWYDQPRATGW